MRRLILTFAVIAPIVAIWSWARGHWVFALALLAASHAPILFATLSPYSSWWGRVVTHFQTTEKEVWITIDDGPSSDTVAFIDLLKRFDARATFFVVGSRALERREDLKRVADAGLSIGNHSFSHPSGAFWCLPRRKVDDQITRGSNAIEEVVGSRPSLFRAPVGMKNFFVHPILRRESLELIAWSARGFDGIGNKEPRAVVESILRDVSPGAIIMLHEGRSRSDGSSVSVEILEQLLTELRARGFRAIVPQSDRLLPPKDE